MALELGVVDIISKTKFDVAAGLESFGYEGISKVRIAMSAKIKTRTESKPNESGASHYASPSFKNWGNKIIVVGSSTGGTEALKDFLKELPPDIPGILIAQHMPESFTKPFANRMNNQCKITVVEAQGGERVLPGHAYIAPGHSHLSLKRSGGHYITELSLTRSGKSFPPICRCFI